MDFFCHNQKCQYHVNVAEGIVYRGAMVVPDPNGNPLCTMEIRRQGYEATDGKSTCRVYFCSICAEAIELHTKMMTTIHLKPFMP